ncbi:hypothetical protein A9Q02_06125 [Candidatus Chloroploca asiatica]|uniref:Uncharacterized protein n=1 Tax=Candidatus Chloroploca asiatica TaxID=1506545 RepID=A0A2H3KNR9_9CHLR|nr:hypothetical protein A9Q02_06125 [Candidatus Chloroploca asiatica]
MPPRAEQQQLAAFFAEAERKQVDFLDEAGKRIIELTTLLLGVLFTVVAFGDTYPPPYLADNILANKKRSLFWDGLTFWAGSGCLALLIGIIIMLA